MASSMVSLSDATAAPETLPGIGILGFECCHCNEATLSKSLRRCYDEQCSHDFCLNCKVIDRAGRLWDKQLGISVHWLCPCGSAHPVIDTLVVDETGKLGKPVCSCREPSFLAMYNTYGRLCKNMGLPIVLPFPLDTAGDVETLVAELERTVYGPRIRLEREGKASPKEVETRGYVNEEWEKASKCWTETDSM